MRSTSVIAIDRAQYEDQEYLASALAPAVKALQANEPIGMPTETVYGLAANALNASAASEIFTVKSRPSDNPLIVHISGLEMFRGLVDPEFLKRRDAVDDRSWKRYDAVIKAFWPGPLTLIFPADPALPKVVTAGLNTVGVRFPSHPIAQALITQCGFPLAAPSANLSGRPSPTTSHHVLSDLQGRISWIVDGGSSDLGIESTVLDLTAETPIILRPGSITLSQLRSVLPDAIAYKKSRDSNSATELGIDENRPATPGMKYRHYSPTAPMRLFALKAPSANVIEGSARLLPHIKAFVEEHPRLKIVRLTVCNQTALPPSELFQEISLSSQGNLAEIAQQLFGALRSADELQPDLIIAEAVVEDEEGMAIMNRLCKSAGEVLHYCE
jgi:L-threonylcarbamoyladenylate synthase